MIRMTETMKTSSFSHFSLVFFLAGAFIFLTAPLLLVVQSKYRGMPYYRKESRQLRRHYLQATVDVYCDRAKRGGEYPEYSVLLIREFLHSGNKITAEAWLRRGVTDWRNPALADYYAKLVSRGILTVPHPRSFRFYLKKKAKEFRNRHD